MDYSNFVQDNISSYDFNDRVTEIVDWIKENRGKFDWAKDQNAYEMTNVFLFGAKYKSEGKDINIDSIKEMWDIRSKDFQNCNISSKSC